MTIKFHRDCPPYVKGDVAGFPPKKEKWLVEVKEVAEYVKNKNSPPVDKMVKNSKTKDKTYKCECGREFDSPQGLGAHQRFCEKAGD